MLKESPRRTVGLLRDDDGRAIVCKRFHHPRRLEALFDRARAENELRILRVLHGRGVRVPRPIEVRRAPRGWEVRMEWIPSALPLLQACASVRAQEGLAAGLGRLLAGLYRAGVRHPDLHAGNVLVDAGGAPWLVDFHQARLRRPARRDVERDLLTALVGLRELWTVRRRQRAFLAFAAHLPPELARLVGDARPLLASLERAARGERRRRLDAGRGRWLRDSGLCRPERARGAPALCRRDLSPEALQRITGDGARLDPRIYALAGLSAAELRAAWATAGALCEHALPALAPAALLEAAPPWAAFEAPSALVGRGVDSAPTAHELGLLLGRLHDRGRDPERFGPSQCVRDDAGQLWLLPRLRLAAFDPAPGSCTPARRFRAVAHLALGGPALAAFADAYASAFGKNPREERALRASLTGVLARAQKSPL